MKHAPRAPLLLLAAIDKLHGLLNTMWPELWASDPDGIRPFLTGPFRRTLTTVWNGVHELLPYETGDNPEAERIGQEMEKWADRLLAGHAGLSRSACEECVRCLFLLNGMLWHRLCHPALARRLKTMNPLSPLRGIFTAFGNESMFDWPLQWVLEDMAGRRTAPVHDTARRHS